LYNHLIYKNTILSNAEIKHNQETIGLGRGREKRRRRRRRRIIIRRICK